MEDFNHIYIFPDVQLGVAKEGGWGEQTKEGLDRRTERVTKADRSTPEGLE